jgi:hypothetical protein
MVVRGRVIMGNGMWDVASAVVEGRRGGDGDMALNIGIWWEILGGKELGL